MAISYYPNRVRDFVTHRNLLDDVDAEHINAIQAELRATMLTLGTSPAVYNDIQTDNVPSAADPNDDGGISDDDSVSFTTTLRYFDPKKKPVDHGSVAQRLDDIERGSQFHAFRLRANGIDNASKSTALSERPRGVRFPKPASSNDPYNLHNGVGVTLRKSGFWIFNGSVVYTLQGSTAGSNNGVYQATIDVDGDYLEGMARAEVSGTQNHPIVNPTLMGFFPRGTRVSLRTSQNSGRNQKIRRAMLAGVLIRESID
jgi:hypothetical protein